MEPNALFRYQYLVGDPVSGGWQDWNTPKGAFGNENNKISYFVLFLVISLHANWLFLFPADWYIGESLNNGRMPVLTYYVMLATAGNSEGTRLLLSVVVVLIGCCN